MATVATRGDALRLTLIASSDIVHLDVFGTIPGVYIAGSTGTGLTPVAALNGVGTGHIKGDGRNIQWKAPGSSQYGPLVNAAVDNGVYMLEDGDDRDKWIKIIVHGDFLAAILVEDKVLLNDLWNNQISLDDVTSGEAAAGDITTYQVGMDNDSPKTLFDLVVWLDASVSDITISEDNAVFVSPTTEATALAFPDLAAAGSDILYIKRTIGAGASSDPDILNHFHFRYWARF